MGDNNNKKLFPKFDEDTRIPCKYGEKCYQKNQKHHEKYKHPFTLQPEQTAEMSEKEDRKRKINDSDEDKVLSLQKYKYKKNYGNISRDVDDCSINENSAENNKSEETLKINHPNDDTSAIEENFENNTALLDTDSTAVEIPDNTVDNKHIISELFLMQMPENFYQFYEFCSVLSNENPCSALSIVNLELVGPYDVLNGKITKISNDDKNKYLRHWRYFYDPPEFQTVLKGNEQDGLHYGYWRDDPEENPVFVAKNYANKNGKIIPVAPNLFSAVQIHIAQRLKAANPFEKNKIVRLLQALKNYSKNHNINLEDTSTEMQSRNRKVVAKTFHGAGIVVPYNKKTQLGYRSLAETDSHLLKLLKQIEQAESDDSKQAYLSKLQEVIRLATIAADECDFGTPLELGHDLFSSGMKSVQQTAFRMLTMSYGLLKRLQFVKIAEAHALNRIKGCDLSTM